LFGTSWRIRRGGRYDLLLPFFLISILFFIFFSLSFAFSLFVIFFVSVRFVFYVLIVSLIPSRQNWGKEEDGMYLIILAYFDISTDLV
jgi:hypothetical protein